MNYLLTIEADWLSVCTRNVLDTHCPWFVVLLITFLEYHL